MQKLFFIAALAMSALSLPAQAQITSYTDRAAFEAAAGAVTVETFDSYKTDTSFRTGLALADFSLTGAGARQDDRNIIDAPQGIFDNYFSINGTSYLLGQVGGFANGTSSFEIVFNTAITAFGADFSNLNDLAGITQIIIGKTVLTPGSVDFYGFVSDTGFSTVQFVSSNPSGPNAIDNFGIDNLTYTASGVVPEPAAWALMILGFGAAGAGLRRQRAIRLA